MSGSQGSQQPDSDESQLISLSGFQGDSGDEKRGQLVQMTLHPLHWILVATHLSKVSLTIYVGVSPRYMCIPMFLDNATLP